MSAEHEHKWRLVTHLDGCHFFGSSYICECGATRVTEHERDIKYDPYSAVWMSESEDCERCVELLNGALPRRHDEIELPK